MPLPSLLDSHARTHRKKKKKGTFTPWNRPRSRAARNIRNQCSTLSKFASYPALCTLHTCAQTPLSRYTVSRLLSHVKCQRCRTSNYLSKDVALLGGVAATHASVELRCATMFGTPLGNLALKTEDLSKIKLVVLVKCKDGFTKTLFSLFF